MTYTKTPPTQEELTAAAICRLKHGDVVYFTIGHDEDDNEYMVAHCTVCGAGVMYGSRCYDHPLMASWSPEHRQTWLQEQASIHSRIPEEER